MADNIAIKKYSFDKVALFVLLLVGLLIAQLIITFSTGLKLSEPIALEQSGLSVSVPLDKGWTDSPQWQYRDNSFLLISVLSFKARPAMAVEWRYLLEPMPIDAENYIVNIAKTSGAVRTGQKTIGELTLYWADIQADRTASTLYGIVQLPNGRTLTLRVDKRGSLAALADDVFETCSESINFEQNDLLLNGKKFLNTFKNAGLTNAIYGRDKRKYFLIKDSGANTFGFLTDGVAETFDEENQKTSITVASMYYIKGPQSKSEESVLESDVFLDGFRWSSRWMGPGGRVQVATDILLDANGIVTVNDTSSRRRKQFAIGDGAICEMLLELVLADYAQTDNASIMLDIIFSKGNITPAVIERIEDDVIAAENPEASFGVKLQFWDGAGTSYIFYFDNIGQIIETQVTGDLNYTLLRTDRRDILAEFPDWSDRISGLDKHLQ